MKEEIETSKGEFFVFNSKGEDFDGFKHNNTYYYKGRIIKLSEITEEQASDIVDLHDVQFSYKILYKLYDIGIRKWCESAKTSLNSLLNSHNIEITPNTYIFKV